MIELTYYYMNSLLYNGLFIFSRNFTCPYCRTEVLSFVRLSSFNSIRNEHREEDKKEVESENK